MMPKPGDVFAHKLPEGSFTAVRVLRVMGNSSLVDTTPYLAPVPPTLGDPLLRRAVAENRFAFTGYPARKWLQGQPPDSFKRVGNLPPTAEEAQMPWPVYGGKWSENSGDEAFLEWRWLHDRHAFEQEVRNQQEDFERWLRRPQKPKKMMDEEEFWSIINRLDWTREGEDEAVLAPAIKTLAAKSKAAICQFQERFAFLLYQLDTRAHADNLEKLPDDPTYISADGFLYTRCVVVASGRAFYDKVLKHPKQMPGDREFESLLYLAHKAYEMKTGVEFDYIGCSYESFSNADGWPEE